MSFIENLFTVLSFTEILVQLHGKLRIRSNSFQERLIFVVIKIIHTSVLDTKSYA